MSIAGMPTRVRSASDGLVSLSCFSGANKLELHKKQLPSEKPTVCSAGFIEDCTFYRGFWVFAQENGNLTFTIEMKKLIMITNT